MPTNDEVTAAVQQWQEWSRRYANGDWAWGRAGAAMSGAMTLADDYPRLLTENDRLAGQLAEAHALLRDMAGDLRQNGAVHVDAYCGQAVDLFRRHGQLPTWASG